MLFCDDMCRADISPTIRSTSYAFWRMSSANDSPSMEWEVWTNWQKYELTEGRTGRRTNWQMDELTEGRTDRRTNWQKDELTEGRTDRRTNRQKDELTEEATNWQKDGQKERLKDKQSIWTQVQISIVIFFVNSDRSSYLLQSIKCQSVLTPMVVNALQIYSLVNTIEQKVEYK